MKNEWLRCGLFLICLLTFGGCEEEFTPEFPAGPDQIVVEGYIEAGSRPTPPYVILTRSLAYFDTLDAKEFEKQFIHNARIDVSDGRQILTLKEVCWNELTKTQKVIAADFLGLDPNKVNYNICLYTDLGFSMMGVEGRTYTLTIHADKQTLTSKTTIPRMTPLDSIRMDAVEPDMPDDKRVKLTGILRDPAGTVNFYRFLTQVNKDPLRSPFPSVTDDALFDGQRFEVPLTKGEIRGVKPDPNTFGLYNRGDSLLIRWMCIDEGQHNFWKTVEYNSVNFGPFSSYTRVDHNIEGGLGVWGGMSIKEYRFRIPAK